MTAIPPLLSVNGLCKSYASVVLDGVDLAVHAGEVHAVVGENGAGKSTLARIIAGVTQPDGGQLRLAGGPFAPRDRTDAIRTGVRLVLQELNLIGNLTVAENIFFERLPRWFGWIDSRRLDRDAREALALVGLENVEPGRLTSTLGIGQQQLVEIAAGLSQRCRLLILDEPTAALSEPEIDQLFARIRVLKADGGGIIYISHRLEEIQRIADRITVLRDGRVVGSRPAREITAAECIRLMVGSELGRRTRRRLVRETRVALRAVGLRRGRSLRNVSFTAHYGEILGFAGLMGSGRTETLRALFGADPLDSGGIFLGDSLVPAGFRGPHDAVRHGLALLTEDRKQQGLLLPLPVRVNLTLADLRSVSRFGGWVDAGAERRTAEGWSRKLAVRCASVEQPVVELSGGNQQKVVIARWLQRESRILLFDEPTRGIDVGARFELYGWLEDLADQGKALLVVSSDLEELMLLADRIAVMADGRIAAVFERGEWSREEIMAAAVGGEPANGTENSRRST